MPGRRQAAECGISLQFTFLFGWRQVFVVPQPVAGVPLRLRVYLSLRMRLLWPNRCRRGVVLLRMDGISVSQTSVRETRNGQGDSYR